MGRAAVKNGRTTIKSWKVCAPEGRGQVFSLWNEQIYMARKEKKKHLMVFLKANC